MKKAYDYLLIGIFIMTALLVAAVGLKMYSGYVDEQAMQAEAERLHLEEIMARNMEANNRVMEMESEISSMIEDVESLQIFIDNAVAIANEVQNRKKLENPEEEIPVMSESVSDDTAVSGNESFTGEESVSGNSGYPDGETVSGNAVTCEGLTVSGNVLVLDGAKTPEEAATLDGMTVSGNTIVLGDAMIAENTVLSDGVTVSGNMAVPNEWAISGDMLLSDGMTLWGNLVLTDGETGDDAGYSDGMDSDANSIDSANTVYYSGEMTVSGNTIVLKDMTLPESEEAPDNTISSEGEGSLENGTSPGDAESPEDGTTPESGELSEDGTMPEGAEPSEDGTMPGDAEPPEDGTRPAGNMKVSGVIVLIGDAIVSGDIVLPGDMSVSGNLILPIDRGGTGEGMDGAPDDAPGDIDGQEDMSLEERKALRTSYQETLKVNQEDKEWIAGNQYDFSETKIACLGDSLTAAANLEGEENYKQYTYPTKLQQLLGAQEVYNLGIGGSSIGRYWADAFVERYTAIPEDTDIIIVMGGTNDGFCVSDDEFGNLDERTYRTFCGDLNELMGGLRENYPEATIFFATPLPNVLQDYLMSEREYLLPQRDFVEVIKTLADEYDFEVVDLYNSNILDSHDAKVIAEYMPDGVHGNPDGYQVLAEHFASEIVQHYHEELSQENAADSAIEEAGNGQEGLAGSAGTGNIGIGTGNKVNSAGANVGAVSGMGSTGASGSNAGTGSAEASGSSAGTGSAEASGSSAGTGSAEASGSSAGTGSTGANGSSMDGSAGANGSSMDGSTEASGSSAGTDSGIDVGAVTDKGKVSADSREEHETDNDSGKSRYEY